MYIPRKLMTWAGTGLLGGGAVYGVTYAPFIYEPVWETVEGTRVTVGSVDDPKSVFWVCPRSDLGEGLSKYHNLKFIYKDDNTAEIRCVVSDTPQTVKTLELVKLGKSSDGQIWERPVEKTEGAITKLTCEMPHPQAAFIVDCKGIGIDLKTLKDSDGIRRALVRVANTNHLYNKETDEFQKIEKQKWRKVYVKEIYDSFFENVEIVNPSH